MRNLLIFLLLLAFNSQTAISLEPTHQYYQKLPTADARQGQYKVELQKMMRNKSQQSAPCDLSKTFACPDEVAMSYNKARKVLFGLLHLESTPQGMQIKEVYCNHTYTESDFPKGRGLGRFNIPDHEVLNAEHTWPQSRFSKTENTEQQKADLHNLYPTENKINAMRGNHPFTEFDSKGLSTICSAPYDEANQSRMDKSGNSFEPPAGHRGNVARSLFYFSVRYNLTISAEEEKYLRKWHNEDPVDEFERNRNDLIHEYQGTRNPFIDMPELANQISDF